MQCATLCPECNEKCTNCSDAEICGGCNICKDCAGGDGNFCDNCETCKMCSEFVCICGGGCSECVDKICPECNEKCENCADDELCIDCGFCADCVGEGNFCFDCSLCITCVEMVCACGNGCSNCTSVCGQCGEVCLNCSDDVCSECGTCIDCADAANFCVNCHKCGDCVVTCVCGEGCEECADICPDCGEKCSECCDEFCESCDLCRECAGEDSWCEECMQCGDCVGVCDQCGLVCESCADTWCEDCGTCSECLVTFCPDCGKCADCEDKICEDCGYCENCGSEICSECNKICADCADICSECGVCEGCSDTCPDCELCEECCIKISAGYGCSHGICINSVQWLSHYCTEGKHCISEDGAIKYDSEHHWMVCGKGCSVRLMEEIHTYGKGEITKDPTTAEEGVLCLGCTECDYEKNESIPKLIDGHEHKYTDVVVAPSCTEGGYTTHTCACGHSWTDSYTAAGEHNYQYKYTDAEHYQECTVCKSIIGRKAHKLGEWKTTKKPGYTYKGEKQRSCRDCVYAVIEELPMLTMPGDKVGIVIPDFPIEADKTDKPSDTTSPDSSDTKPSAPSDTTSGSPSADTKPGGSDLTTTDKVPDDTSKPGGDNDVQTTIKEILTKGENNTVPALPTLPATNDGNEFDGWVNKATGEPVKKGDVLTGSIEIAPVWKDCGTDKHTDKNEDGRCDGCGYYLVKPETTSPEDAATDTPDATDTAPITDGSETTGSSAADGQDTGENGNMPVWFIPIIVVGAVVVLGCGGVMFFVLRKKKDNE